MKYLFNNARIEYECSIPNQFKTIWLRFLIDCALNQLGNATVQQFGDCLSIDKEEKRSLSNKNRRLKDFCFK